MRTNNSNNNKMRENEVLQRIGSMWAMKNWESERDNIALSEHSCTTKHIRMAWKRIKPMKNCEFVCHPVWCGVWKVMKITNVNSDNNKNYTIDDHIYDQGCKPEKCK